MILLLLLLAPYSPCPYGQSYHWTLKDIFEDTRHVIVGDPSASDGLCHSDEDNSLTTATPHLPVTEFPAKHVCWVDPKGQAWAWNDEYPLPEQGWEQVIGCAK